MRPALILAAGLLSTLVFTTPAAAQTNLPYCGDPTRGTGGGCQEWRSPRPYTPCGGVPCPTYTGPAVNTIYSPPVNPSAGREEMDRQARWRAANPPPAPYLGPRNGPPAPGRGAPAWEGDDPSRAGEITIVWD